MPFAQLVTSGIELAMNQLLKLDDDSQQRLKKLSGKSLQVTIKELPWPLLFSFSEQIDVRIVLTPDSDSEPPCEPVDCLIELNLETLPKLKDSSQLTQLIQQKQLSLIGDIYVAQTFSALLKDLDVDWEEQLSRYTGDVMAHQTFTTMRTLFDTAKSQIEQGAIELGEYLTQSDSIAVKPSEMIEFSRGVSDLRSSTERLSAKIALLEQAKKVDTGLNN
ncbi:SCP2 domain-containing protein [Paraglaciecola sp. MB-3u-78]|uniref:ubiquinone biosynthesis accessory factor UbiJ n=1 Tax=Paraglaciecola sp. MB-3u-78 TaxID=2058332 RepID=UPI000C331BBE|nr:SCP2 sterol-binding domain-containing protein [Paraglaciecola sp. MB-3u-78]PKG98042.1 sterol-binding protein [Paraglaciecola sp. MB-3u-78]